MDATEKLLRHRFVRWQAGQYNQIWRDVVSANNKLESNRRAKRIDKQNSDQDNTIPGSVLANITRLVETGQLSRAASRLLSRGIAELTPENILKLQSAFPSITSISTGRN